MANERAFAEQQAYERRLMGRGILRRRALGLIVIGLVFMFMAGVNLDVFDATVGCIAAAAGGAWRWYLGKAPSDAMVGRNGKLHSEKVPATRRDPYFP